MDRIWIMERRERKIWIKLFIPKIGYKNTWKTNNQIEPSELFLPIHMHIIILEMISMIIHNFTPIDSFSLSFMASQFSSQGSLHQMNF